MKWIGALACLLVAGTCIEKATGMAPQSLLADDALWFWWVVVLVVALTKDRP